MLEKKYNVFAPYLYIEQLKNKWDDIIVKCRYLQKLNLENKVLLNKKIYLNQRFLELLDFHKNEVIYDSHGELKK